MTKDEYNKTLMRMYDSMRGDKYRGYKDCNGIKCDGCLFQSFCYGSGRNHSAYDLVAFVEQWAKEHPVATRADKFKETFGFFPIDDGQYCCPIQVGASMECVSDCENCTKKFWESEYIEPKKE